MRDYAIKRVKSQLDRARVIAHRHDLSFDDQAARNLKSFFSAHAEDYPSPQIRLYKDGRLGLFSDQTNQQQVFGERQLKW